MLPDCSMQHERTSSWTIMTFGVSMSLLSLDMAGLTLSIEDSQGRIIECERLRVNVYRRSQRAYALGAHLDRLIQSRLQSLTRK